MSYKRIPFDYQKARELESAEPGKHIVSGNLSPARVISWDGPIKQYPIVVKFANGRSSYYSIKGKDIDSEFSDLYLFVGTSNDERKGAPGRGEGR